MNFINGEFVPSVSGKTIPKVDPSTSQVARQVPDSSLLDLVKAVQSGNKALIGWSKSSIEDRAIILEKFAFLIRQNAQMFGLAAARDLGTPVSQTLSFSVEEAAQHFEAHAKMLRAPGPLLQRQTVQPVGLVAIISPASDPLVCLSSRLAPALAGGNAVIAKPSRHTPETTELLAKLSLEAGLPAGVFGIVQGRGDVIGELIVQHPGVSTLAFMGSTRIGRRIQSLAADELKRVHLSLSSKNPVIVFAGVELVSTMSSVAAICAGLFPARSMQGSRLFIHESIYKPALEMLKAHFESVRVGSPFEIETQMGPLPTQELVGKFHEAVALARFENGRVITQTPPDASNNNFVRPVLVADLTNCSTLQQDEIIGPLVLASSFKYQHEVLKHINNSPYGRAAFIFEPEMEKAERVAGKTEVGSIFINLFTPTVKISGEVPLLKNSGNLPEGLFDLANFFSRHSVLR